MRAKRKIPHVKRSENEWETAGPRTGNWKTYNRLLIPIVKSVAPAKMMLHLFLKKQQAAPMPSPNNPVVKGNTNSSLG